MVTPTRLTLDQYLALPATKPYQEFVRGELVQKAMPNEFHSRLVKELIFILESFIRPTANAYVDTELRHIARQEGRVYLPDVSMTLRERRGPLGQGPVEVPPDLAVEVLSPDDRAGGVLEKADFYMRIGVSLLWLVDPDTRTVTAYRPGRQPEVLRVPAALDAVPALPGFRLPLDTLFAVIEEPYPSA